MMFQRLIFKRSFHKAYFIKPSTKAQEQQNQACYLTKTILKPGLPSVYTDNDLSFLTQDERSTLVYDIKRCILETNVFQRDEKFTLKKHTKDRMREKLTARFQHHLSLPLLLNLWKVLWSSDVSRKFGFHSKNLSYKPDIDAPWERLEDKVQVSGRIGHLVCGKSLLPLFDENITGSAVEGVMWDDIISPFFDLPQLKCHFKASSGFHLDSPYPCPQTLMIVQNPFNWYPRFHTGQGVFYCFAHAMNYALSNGEVMGEDLKRPVPVQYLSFNGTTFFFVCYQLNTLNFDENNKTVKNFAWVAGEELLYNSVRERVYLYNPETHEPSDDAHQYIGKQGSLTQFNRKELAETFENPKVLEVSVDGFNKDTASLFINFLLNKPL